MKLNKFFMLGLAGLAFAACSNNDEAEEAFKEMLDEDANKDYALDELAYIQKLREIMNDKNKTSN